MYTLLMTFLICISVIRVLGRFLHFSAILSVCQPRQTMAQLIDNAVIVPANITLEELDACLRKEVDCVYFQSKTGWRYDNEFVTMFEALLRSPAVQEIHLPWMPTGDMVKLISEVAKACERYPCVSTDIYNVDVVDLKHIMHTRTSEVAMLRLCFQD